jgi:hypothetical protein
MNGRDIERIGALIQVGLTILGKSLTMIQTIKDAGELTPEQREEIDASIDRLKDKYKSL